MQPGMSRRFGAERQQGVMRVFISPARQAAAGRRLHRIAVEPFADAAIEGTHFSFLSWQAAVELVDTSPFVDEGQPVLARPAVIHRPQQCHYAGVMAGQQVEDGTRRRSRGFEHEPVTLDPEPYARGSRDLSASAALITAPSIQGCKSFQLRTRRATCVRTVRIGLSAGFDGFCCGRLSGCRSQTVRIVRTLLKPWGAKLLAGMSFS